MSSTVARDQRFTRFRPCPICGGWDSLRRGQGVRCPGFRSQDGGWAHCTREEYAGAIQPSPASPPTYAHRLDGPCRCGVTHGTGSSPSTLPARRPIRESREPRPQRGPFPSTLPSLPGAHLARIFPYYAASGHLLYSVLRYEWPIGPGQTKPEKTFQQTHPLTADMWAWGLGETPRVLYRQRELLAAPAHRPIFITEGEHKADALAALGLLATTAPEGSGKWRQVASRHEVLAGRHVVILPDHDEPGKRHAADVAADLAGIAASVRVLALPCLCEHGDVVDWLGAGGTKDGLYELVIATPAAAPHVASEPPPEPHENQVDFRAANVRLNQRLQLVYRTAAVKTDQLSASAVKTLLVVRHELERGAYPLDADGMARVYLPTLAEKCGVSAGTLGANLRDLAAVGALRRASEWVTTDDGRHRVERIWIGLGPAIDAPETWHLPDGPRQQGGKRAGAGRPRTCPAPGCGSTDIFIVEYTVTETHCRTCGVITPVRGPSHRVYDAADTADEANDDEGEDENQVDFGALDSMDAPPETPEPVPLFPSFPAGYPDGGKLGPWETSSKKEHDAERWKRVHDGG